MKWIKVSDELPPIDPSCQWSKHNSKKVLIHMTDDETDARFGTYNHLINHWSVDGYLGFQQDRITHWATITLPKD